MQEGNEGKIVKIFSPFEFLVEDIKDKKHIKIQIKPSTNKCYAHLLPSLYKQSVSYELEKKKSNKIR